jgi:putative Holliday junction resolvase
MITNNKQMIQDNLGTKIMGIDFGSKRVGIALSDNSHKYAFPKSVLPNNSKLVDEICKICQSESVEKIVVGDSKAYDQTPNKIMESVKLFVEDLKLKTNIPIIMHNEMMTSLEASRIQGEHNLLDASAAALILKSYIDTNNNK